ncbi:MAG TPA: hypothetical protein VIO11_09375 [Candidatus Methanoperedens sp.]
MALTVNVKKDFSIQEVSNVIRSALALDERIAKYKRAKYTGTCQNFEKKYGMNSEIFMQKFDPGQLDDRDDFFDWYAAKKGLDNWNKKLEILSGISI